LNQEERFERTEVLMKQNWRRALVAAATTMVASGALAASASAGVLVTTTTSCPSQSFSTPFTPWYDSSQYTPVPGGTFEGGASGWTLSGGARVTGGNESYKVSGADDATSLRLPLGSSALSAPVCVGLEYPTMRFFAKRNGGLLTTLAVTAQVQLSLGGTLDVPFGVVASGGQWTPTPAYLFLGNLLPLLPGQYTSVRFRFVPVLGDWSIDDVYVDPLRSR
jgi:hypothetical protein